MFLGGGGGTHFRLPRRNTETVTSDVLLLFPGGLKRSLDKKRVYHNQTRATIHVEEASKENAYVDVYVCVLNHP